MNLLISKLFNKRKIVKSESEYINDIAAFQKECWRYSLNEEAIMKETKKYVNKLNLTEESHSYLIEFKKDLNDIYKNEKYNKERYIEVLKKFYAKKNEYAH